MIPKITKGRSAYGALGYDHGPGRRDEHTNPHKVAGNVAGKSWRERAKAIDSHAQAARPDVARPIHRTALRLSPEDRALSDREWSQVAERYIKRMGWDGCPWEATRHAEDHIHLTVSRVRWDGSLASDSHDYAKAQTACREIERRHRLVNAAEKFRRAEPQITAKERDSAARRGVEPEREQLRAAVRAAESQAGGTREGYEAALAAQGVNYRANIASTGRVSGYSYSLDGHRDAQGEAVYFKGSQLGKDFAWSRSQKRMGLDREPNKAAAHLTTRERETAAQNAQRRRTEQQRPGVVRADRDNPARTPEAQRRAEQEHQAQRKDNERMSKPESTGHAAAVAMTRAEAMQKATEAARRRIEEQEQQREAAAQAQDKGRER